MKSRPAPLDELDRSQIWNCWTNNMYNDDDGMPGYIIHAFDARGKGSPRTFCGVKWQETGMLSLTGIHNPYHPERYDEYPFTPSCIKCRRFLEKRSLIDAA